MTPEQTRGARVTGAWALPLMAIGFVLAVLPGVVFLLVVLFFAVIGLFTGGLVGALFIGFITAIFGGVVATTSPWLVIAPIVVGLAAFIGGSWGSVRALRKLGIRSPRKATWSAFGVGFATQTGFAVVLYVLLVMTFGVFTGAFGDGEAVPLFFTGSAEDLNSPLLAREITFHTIMLAATAAIGVLYWPIFARITTRRVLVREAARQQQQAAAEWAAYEYALWQWQTQQWQTQQAAAVGEVATGGGCETGGDGESN